MDERMPAKPSKGVLYMMIVDMPTEEQLAAATKQLRRAS